MQGRLIITERPTKHQVAIERGVPVSYQTENMAFYTMLTEYRDNQDKTSLQVAAHRDSQTDETTLQDTDTTRPRHTL